MTHCEHCGTEFSPKTEMTRFCCKGCEFVAELISENGFEQFYDLKQGIAVAPVRSRPFEEHHFSWLAPKIIEAETKANSKHEGAQLDLALEGISCVGCVWLVEKLFSRHAGSIRAAANPSSGNLHLQWIPGACDLEPFLRELCRFGYVAAPAGSIRGDHERRRLTARMGLCGAFALNTMGFSLPLYLGMPANFEFAGLFNLIAFLSATLSMLVGGGYFIDRAWRALKTRSLHLDLPIALGLISAYMGSIAGWILGSERLMYFDFVSIFVFLMLTGRFLQSSAVERNRRRLVRQQPVPEAVPSLDPELAPIARDQIFPGLKFFLAPGQALPVSGVLAAGEADFSLEWIHGEADPVKYTAGTRLPAGAILLSRTPAAIEASESWKDSLIAKLTAPAHYERGTPGLERLLKAYLSIVLLTGLAALIFWVTRGDWLTGAQAMISVFVVSCPCALGVAIPLADDLAAAAMERLGVFTRSATLWPRLRRIRRVIFDKTGTLTLERPVLENPETVEELPEDAALALAIMTIGSLHPIARSLLEASGMRGQKLLSNAPITESHEFAGLGISMKIGNTTWSLGRSGWSGLDSHADAAKNAGSELRKNGNIVATFRFQESLRPGTTAMLRNIEKRGLSIFLLSGDHPSKVEKMAKSLGLPDNQSFGGLSPDEKAAAVKAIDQEDTLYLGDGANDSLAFDAAFVTGTPVVDRSLLESKADFFIIGSGLEFLPRLLDTAASREIAVRTAFGFAILYNLITVAFSSAGMMSPLLAAILMPLSSIVSIVLIACLSRRA